MFLHPSSSSHKFSIIRRQKLSLFYSQSGFYLLCCVFNARVTTYKWSILALASAWHMFLLLSTRWQPISPTQPCSQCTWSWCCVQPSTSSSSSRTLRLLPPLPGACWNSGPSRRWPNRYVGTPSMSIGELDLLLHGGGRRLIFLSQKQSAVLQHYTKEPTRCHPLYIQRVRTSVWHEDPLLFLETKQIPYSDMAPLWECDLWHRIAPL